MTKLQCGVSSCAHYAEGKCSLAGIRVDGPAACSCGQTCCGSFEEALPSAGNVTVRRELSGRGVRISCRAGRCRYNDGGDCTANRVQIGCCGCGHPYVSSETECRTFEER